MPVGCSVSLSRPDDSQGVRAQPRSRVAVCSEIGNDNFTWLGTTASKSRLNFLGLLRDGFTDYVVNDAALAYMRAHALAEAVVQQLAIHRRRVFNNEVAWLRHLRWLRIDGRKLTPRQIRIATEGALRGAGRERGFLHDAVIISDDAGQFVMRSVHLHRVGERAFARRWRACIAERLVDRRETFADTLRAARKHERGLIWRFCAALKACRLAPSARRCRQLRVRFERIFHRRPISAAR